MTATREYLPKERLVLVVGNYGSGKTEVSVSLALQLSRAHRTAIADLDVVNPYFRCREARAELEGGGVRVINPEGEFHSADLPIILPEIRGAVQGGEEYVILDVGGDDVGARVLSSLADLFAGRPYVMLQVVNAMRPFTETVEGCLKIKGEIEAASRLRVSAFAANTHLMDETTADVVAQGIELARRLAETTGLPLAFATLDERLAGDAAAADALSGVPVLWMHRRMVPPWQLPSMTDRAGRVLRPDEGSREE